MKILHIITDLNCGGAEHFVCNLLLELHSQSNDCELLCLYDIDIDNYLFRRLSSKIKVSSLHKPVGFSFSSLFKILVFIKRGGYEVVNAHLGAINYMLLPSAMFRSIRFFATIHSDARFEAFRPIEFLIRWILFKTALCSPITISEESRKSFRSLYNTDSYLIYNAAPAYSPSEVNLGIRDFKNQVVFLHPASCQPIKNQVVLLKAFNRLLIAYPDLKLLWVGAKGANNDLFDSLSPLFGRNITYLGVVNNVCDYLAQVDAMCLSSLAEGMPITVIEAFSTGCIPICTPAGGCKNMIENGVNGILAGGFDEESYYSAMKRFIDLPSDARKQMKVASLESYSKYDISSCAQSYSSLYSHNG